MLNKTYPGLDITQSMSQLHHSEVGMKGMDPWVGTLQHQPLPLHNECLHV
jgi:hypothetical protein